LKTIKSQRTGLLTKVIEDPGGAKLVVSALAFFPLETPGALGSEVGMWKFAAEALGPETPLDFAMPKPRGEVLVTGKAFPRGGTPRPACSVRVRLGSVDKTLYVVGDRKWRHGVATDPEPFTEMPITWANAFGGPGYPQNPLGKGHESVRDERGEHHPLPNIEDPKRLVSSPRDRPAPAGFGPYDLTWPQRYAKIGTYDAVWLQERYPGFAADFDPTYFNAAPPDQQIEGYFRGDEAITLENLHPDKPVLEGALPSIKARIFLNSEKDGIALREVPMRAETVHLFPNAGRGIVIFRGVARVVTDDASDVLQLLAAFEAFGEPKPLEHYATVLAQRLDRKKGHLYVLRDKDLLPAALARAPRDADGEEMKALLKKEGFRGDNMRRRMERVTAEAYESARETMVAHGLEPPPPPAPLPPKMKAAELDELPEVVEKIQADVAAMRVEADERFLSMQKLARAECEKSGIDYDKAVLEQQAKGGGPPKFSAAGRLAELRKHAAQARSLGAPVPELEAKLEAPVFFATLEKAEKMLRDGYRLFAHYMTPATRLEGDEAAGARAYVVATRDAGESLFGRDLTGADLSRMDLRGADLRLAFLEQANLEGADLRGADLRTAVLARANLAGANLAGAKLGRTNLGGANLTHADVSGADLTKAILANADLSHASFAGAALTDADLGKAKFDQTDFRGARASGLTLLKSDLRGLLLAGADLTRCIFLQTSIDGVDFTNAVLAGAVMMSVTAKGCVFRGANLTGLMVVKESSLEGASFAGADLTKALLRSTNLAGADFSDANLTGADLSDSDLTAANLEHAVARGALFMKSNLTRANLKRADLMDTILQGAKLRGATLETANLFRADMLKADVDAGTITKGANLKSLRFIQQKRPHGKG
jgi:uncharacterized protein YjbI with pentapeptide repeats